MKSIGSGAAGVLMQKFINARKNGSEVESTTSEELANNLGSDKACVYRWAYEARKDFKEHLDSIGIKSDIHDLLQSNGHGGYQINPSMKLLLCRPKMKN